MTGFKTNRKTGNVFPTGQSEISKPVGSIIADAPEIVGFEYAGSVYVEDGDGSRYTVKYADGHTAEVEISDAFDSEFLGDPEEGEEITGEPRTVQVVWDGAVDFYEGYDAADSDSVAEIKNSLISRYGKIAEDFL